MKKTKFLLTVFTVLIIAGIFNSCSKEEHFNEDAIALRQDSQELLSNARLVFTKEENSKIQYTVLGAKRNNPFTVSNINLAKSILYGTKHPSKSLTHRYVKFLPSTQEHLALLEDWETEMQIALFDFPLEYERVMSGENYIDPSVSDSLFTYQYTSIPIDIEVPDVPYEVIDDLYLDKSDLLLLAESFWLTGNHSEINEYILKGGLTKDQVDTYDDDVIAACVPPPPEEDCPPGYDWKLVIDDSQIGPGGRPVYIWKCRPVPPPPPPATNDCGCPLPNYRYPAGCVKVLNDLNNPIAVQIASILVIDNWFNWDYTYTNAQGCWQVNDSYSGTVWMWVRFKNRNVKVRDTRYYIAARVIRDYVGKFTAPPYNNIYVEYSNGPNTDQNPNTRMYWAAAHALNTVNEYRSMASSDGIPLPRRGLNWTNHEGGGGAATPMLQNNLFNSWIAFAPIFWLPPGVLTAPLWPDIMNQYDTGEDADVFTGTGFHELGHASHYSLVGEGYWFGYRNHIINNLGYGSFGNFNFGSNPGKVALGEAIGNFTGAIYGGTVAGGENFEWEDNFIPRGLMWDLGDDTPWDIVTNPNNATIFGPDNISGFTRQMIFNGLTLGVTDIRSFRNRLRTLHLNDTPNNTTDYNTFVDLYDVFNN